MSLPKPTVPFYKHERWFAVYGSAVTAQVFEHMRMGLGAPNEELMLRFVEEAVTIANMAEEALEALKL